MCLNRAVCGRRAVVIFWSKDNLPWNTVPSSPPATINCFCLLREEWSLRMPSSLHNGILMGTVLHRSLKIARAIVSSLMQHPCQVQEQLSEKSFLSSSSYLVSILSFQSLRGSNTNVSFKIWHSVFSAFWSFLILCSITSVHHKNKRTWTKGPRLRTAQKSLNIINVLQAIWEHVLTATQQYPHDLWPPWS